MKSFRHFNDDSLPVKIATQVAQDPTKLHGHDFHELVIILSGEGIHFTENDRYRIRGGDVFLIKPGKHHGYENTNNLALINILYLPEKLGLPLYDLKDIPGYHAFFDLEPAMRQQHGFKSRLKLPNSKIIYLKELVSKIENELLEQNKGTLFAVSSYLMQIFLFISRNYTGSEEPSQTNIFKLGSILSYIEKNYQKEISLSALIKQAKMSETTLFRMFQKSFGMSPINYVISIRIEKAKEMLYETDKTITEIAWNCGFSDSNYFSRIFKKNTGLTPRDFRKKSYSLYK